MAETFPVGFSVINLRPRTGITWARERSNLIVTSRSGPGVWSGHLTTGKLSMAEYADFSGFVNRVVEQNLRVDFVHPRFAVPRSYTADTWPLTGEPELVEAIDGYTLSVFGLEAGMTLKRGDRLSLVQDGLPPCYRELAADVTVASAIAQHLTVSPRLPPGAIAPAAIVRFIDPAVRLAIVPDTFDGTEEYRPVPVSIDVEEDGL